MLLHWRSCNGSASAEAAFRAQSSGKRSSSLASTHQPSHILPDVQAFSAQVFVLNLISLVLTRVPRFALRQSIEARAQNLDMVHELMQQDCPRFCIHPEIERLLDVYAFSFQVESPHWTCVRAYARLQLLKRNDVYLRSRRRDGITGDHMNSAEQFQQQRGKRLVAHAR